MDETCTLETIAGTYIFQAQGVIIGQDEEVHTYAEAGTWTLDGEGNAVGVLSASVDGASSVRRESFTATYELSSDCVFTAADAFGLEFELYTTPSGETVTYFSPGFSGTQVRR